MIIKTYKELQFYLEMFRNGNADLMILEGPGGLSKSKMSAEIMKEQQHLRIVSHVSPMRLYSLGFENLNLPIIFEDTDCLLQNDSNIALLKMFTDTNEVKEINWYTSSSMLDQENIPEKYETRSKCLIICNSFDAVSDKISALRDRGIHIRFFPTTIEILNKMKEILPEVHKDLTTEEKLRVYYVIEKYANVCDNLSLRTLVKGLALFKECKNKGIEWQTLFLNNLELNQKLILLDSFMRQYKKEEDRIKAWEDAGFSKRSYYDYRNKLNAKLQTTSENVCEAPLSQITCNPAN